MSTNLVSNRSYCVSIIRGSVFSVEGLIVAKVNDACSISGESECVVTKHVKMNVTSSNSSSKKTTKA